MAARETIEIDLDRIDRLIEREEAELEPKHRASIEYREIAERHVAGGVASSWQASPPHAIFIDRGEGNRIWDIDGNEYVDFHLGYGAMVVGHAHPGSSRRSNARPRAGTHFAQPTKDLDVIGENLADRFTLPLWRFCNSGTEATLEARAADAREHRPRHAHQDRGHLPRPPRLADVLRGPRSRATSARASTRSRCRRRSGIPQAFADLVVVVPFNDLDAVRRAFEEHPGEVAGMIVEPAMMNCGVILPEPGYLAGPEGPLPRARRVPRVRRGEDRCDARLRRRDRGVRRRARHRLPGQGDRRRHCRAARSARPRSSSRPVLDGEYDMAGTFNGNPLTMAAIRAALTEVLVGDVYDAFNRDRRGDLKDGLRAVIERYRLPAYVTRRRREGLGDLFDHAGPRVPRRDRHRRADHATSPGCSSRTAACSSRRGRSRRPGRCRCRHTEDDVARYVENFEEFATAVSGG